MSENYIKEINKKIQNADAVVIGAGAGLSTSAGLSYGGKRFTDNFSDFVKRYGMEDMYSAGFYPFETQEEKWAYWSKHIFLNRYEAGKLETYCNLLELIKDKNYFVITTNVDHQFLLSGFDKDRIFATQGDYGIFQCANKCHNKLYSNEKLVREMIEKQKNLKIPSNLVPKCPVCGGKMAINIRCDEYFVEDELWHKSYERYEKFIDNNKDKNLLFLELGVGMNTPGIIKYPFYRMTYSLDNAFYISINQGEAWVPKEINNKSICVNDDISKVICELREKK